MKFVVTNKQDPLLNKPIFADSDFLDTPLSWSVVCNIILLVLLIVALNA